MDVVQAAVGSKALVRLYAFGQLNEFLRGNRAAALEAGTQRTEEPESPVQECSVVREVVDGVSLARAQAFPEAAPRSWLAAGSFCFV